MQKKFKKTLIKLEISLDSLTKITKILSINATKKNRRSRSESLDIDEKMQRLKQKSVLDS